MNWNWKLTILPLLVSASLLTAQTQEPPAAEKPAENKFQRPPGHPGRHGRQLRRHGTKNFHRRNNPRDAFFAKLTVQERTRISELVKARKKDELRKYMRELMIKYRPEEMKKMDALSAKYCASKDEKEKASIKQQMRTLARIIFKKRLEYTKNNILFAERQLQRAKADLDRLKKHYERSRANEEKLIERQVERMCLPPEQRKRGHHHRGPAKGSPNFRNQDKQ